MSEIHFCSCKFYLTLSSFFLKVLRTRLLILDFNRSCGIEGYSVEKSNGWTDVAVRTSSWSSDDNKLVEFFRIHMLLTPLRLVYGVTIPRQSILYST